MIVVGTQRFQRVVGAEDATATGAQHVPAQIEKPKAGGMQESGNHLFFVERGVRGKVQHIDAVERGIIPGLDQLCDRVSNRRVGRLLQNRNLGVDLAHGTLSGIALPLKQSLFSVA